MGTREDKTGAPPAMDTSPPPYEAPPRPANQTTTTYVTMSPAMVTTVITGPVMGPDSSSITCPSCNTVIMTRVEQKPTVRTHLLAVLLCLICCPCVFVPYCVKSCNDVNHYCPNCNAYIGKYQN